MQKFLAETGRKSHEFFIEIARLSQLAASSFYWLFIAPIGGKRGFRREAVARQMVFTGNDSFLIVALVTAAVGAVLALQAAYQLKQFGAVLYTGSLVAVSMTRELGPVVAAIVIAGRVGASITAQLGTMQVQEEVDALTTMGVPPVPFLVVPRMLALAVMLPVLTALGDAIGMFGGYLIGVLGLGISSGIYIQNSFNALVPKDILSGLIKSFIFAILIGAISTYKGLSVQGGADGVGKATTESVVLSIIAIIVADCIATAIFFYVLV